MLNSPEVADEQGLSTPGDCFFEDLGTLCSHIPLDPAVDAMLLAIRTQYTRIIKPSESGAKLRRELFHEVSLAIMLLSSLGQLYAQNPSGAVQPSVSPSQLQTRMELIEKQREELLAKGGTEEATQFRALTEELLSLAEQEELLRQSQSEEGKSLIAPLDVINIPVVYITDRQRGGDGKHLSVQRTEGLEFGQATVSIDTAATVRTDLIAGTKRLPPGSATSGMSFKAIPDLPGVLKQLTDDTNGPGGRRRKVLFLVPGFNTSFEEALQNTARLSTQVQTPVIPVTFSWPSTGFVAGYLHDEEQVRLSEQHFTPFLKEFLQGSPVDVVLACHSMGCRLLIAALSQFGAQNITFPNVREVILVAADISTAEFLRQWKSAKLRDVRFTSYSSAKDHALRVSSTVHQGLRRLGDASQGIDRIYGLDTINASSLESPKDFWKHSYLFRNFRIGADIGQLIESDSSPQDRQLIRDGKSEDASYAFQ